MTQVNLPENLFKILTTDIPKRYPAVKKIWLFGSRATGTHRATSDIDLAFDAPGLPPSVWLQMTHDIDQETMFKIDCVDLAEATIDLRQQIQQRGMVIYG